MPTDGKTKAYGFLDQLSTEQLLNLLRADFDSSEAGDDELVLRILEVIEKREQEKRSGPLPDVDQAWEDFQRYFNTPDGTDRSLYPMRDSAARNEAKPANRRGRRLKRLLPLAAAIMTVTFSSMIAAQALGFDVFGALARWTDETFHFVTGPTDPAAEALRQAVQGAFDDCGITIPAPAWYPDDTKLARNIDIIKDGESSTVACGLIYNSKSFFITVQQYHVNDRVPSYTLEKDATAVEEYSSNGRLFYIMSNLSTCRAVHSSDQTVMVIEGNLSSEFLKKIVDSIGE